MRILYVVMRYGEEIAGGAEQHCRDFAERIVQRGHDVEVLAPFDEVVGHAGAILRDANGMLQGGTDPRSDGGVAAW